MTNRAIRNTFLALAVCASSARAEPVPEFAPSPIPPKKASCAFKSGDKGVRINGTVIFEPTESLNNIARMGTCEVFRFSDQYVFLAAMYDTQPEDGLYPAGKTVLELAVLNKEFNRYQSVFNTIRDATDAEACKGGAAGAIALSWGYSSKNQAVPVVGIPSCDASGMSYYVYDPVKGFAPF